MNFKSVRLPLILTLVIEASVWMNLGFPYFSGTSLFYIGYLIIGTVQLGATIDYAILFTERYLDFRKKRPKRDAARQTLKVCTLPVLTSSLVLALAGAILGLISTNKVLSQLGTLVGRGAVLSFALVIFILPSLLILFDGLIRKTTLHADFFGGRKQEAKDRSGKAEDGKAENVFSGGAV